jgi:hypothetical protein
MFTDLDKSFVREGYVHADDMDEARKLLFLVIVDAIAIFQDTFDRLNERYEFVEVCSEFLGIGDVEEDVELGLLRKAAPTK